MYVWPVTKFTRTHASKLTQENISEIFSNNPPPPPPGGGTEPGFFEKAGDYLFRGGKDKAALDAAASTAKQDAIQKSLADATAAGLHPKDPAVIANALKAGDAAAAGAGPGLITTYGPSLALAGAGAYASGFFDKPEEPDMNIDDIQGTTGADLLAENPSKYLVEGGDTRLRGADGQFVVPTDYAFLGNRPVLGGYIPRNPFIQQAAEGGEIFPRRVGGIMPDEGIPGKDSVRAMLMPGEFVMTTDAVKGLGNGNNQVGINRMYDMMRGLDAKGKAMA